MRRTTAPAWRSGDDLDADAVTAGLSRVHARVTFGEEPITRTCRKVLAIDLHAAVSSVFVQIK